MIGGLDESRFGEPGRLRSNDPASCQDSLVAGSDDTSSGDRRYDRLQKISSMHGVLPFLVRSRAPKPHVLHFGKAGNDESLEDDERLPDACRVDPAREEQCNAVQRPNRIAGDNEPVPPRVAAGQPAATAAVP